MAISFVGGNQDFAANGGNVALTLPGSMAQDDLVIVTYATGTNFDHDMSISDSGWTEVADLIGSDTRIGNVGVFYKFMGASPDVTATCVGTGGGSDVTIAACLAFRGVKLVANGGPFDATSTTNTGINGTNVDPPAITWTTAGTWTVLAYGTSTATSVGTAVDMPAGYVTNQQVQVQAETRPAMHGIGYNSSPASTENPADMDMSGFCNTSDGWAAVTMALASAAPPAPPTTIIRHGVGRTAGSF